MSYYKNLYINVSVKLINDLQVIRKYYMLNLYKF